MRTSLRLLSAVVIVLSMTVSTNAQGISGARQACDGGTAAGFACSNVDLISWMDRSQLTTSPVQTDPFGNVIQPSFNMNDMWGWKHAESGRSFLIVGRYDGTSFVEVTDPYNPVLIGELPSDKRDGSGNVALSAWRDMKVYADHAYIVADSAPGHGMQVFDLTQLLSYTHPVVFEPTARYQRISSAHNIVINEDTGYAYIVGARGSATGDDCGSGLHMIDLSEPGNPQFAGCYSEYGTSRGGGAYTHDAHCVVYAGPDEDWQGAEICVNSNEQSVVITNVSDKQAPSTISVGQYPATEYTHQGWLTDDHRYYFQGDELDEARGSVGNTRTIVWDLQDLDDPVVAAEYLATRRTIDHNMYVRGHLLFQSQYVDGLRILNISDPEAPEEVGFFDTHPADLGVWDGSWSNYPYMEDGMVAVTSSVDGLFILQPHASLLTGVEGSEALPSGISLLDAYPNPFGAQSMLQVAFSRSEFVRIEIVDMLGRTLQTVFEGDVQAGQTMRHTVFGDGLSAGTYLVRVRGESFESSRQIIKVQ